MPNFIPIDASKARNDFFNLLARVYEGDVFLVKKSGIPVAKMVKPETSKGEDIMEFAGKFKDLKDKKLVASIYKTRKDSVGRKRKLPTI